MKAQETEDAELIALAALVAYDTACINADVAKYGEPQCDPTSESARVLRGHLIARGVLPAIEPTRGETTT